ncbi:MAG: hypothetical protein IPG94_03260 [Kineosporiaceae bacterium]|nr:hypothetical protein [Kineosporiaceae bacterium]
MTAPRRQTMGRITGGIVLAGAAFLAPTGSASAVTTTVAATTWVTDDTDLLEVASTNGKAEITPATIVWQHEGGIQVYEDARAAWQARLRVDGGPNSCAYLKVTTYMKDNNGNESISKLFPAKGTEPHGYFHVCKDDGKGSNLFTGADVIDNHLGAAPHHFSRVVAEVCYAKDLQSVGFACAKITKHPGD